MTRVLDSVAILAGTVAVGGYLATDRSMLLILGSYGLLVGTSTAVVSYCLSRMIGLEIATAGGSDGAIARSWRRRAWALITGSVLRTGTGETPVG